MTTAELALEQINKNNLLLAKLNYVLIYVIIALWTIFFIVALCAVFYAVYEACERWKGRR